MESIFLRTVYTTFYIVTRSALSYIIQSELKRINYTSTSCPIRYPPFLDNYALLLSGHCISCCLGSRFTTRARYRIRSSAQIRQSDPERASERANYFRAKAVEGRGEDESRIPPFLSSGTTGKPKVRLTRIMPLGMNRGFNQG